MVVLAIACGVGADARAQTKTARPKEPGRIEIAVGGLWIGGNDYGSIAATETTSAGGTSVLFSTSSLLTASPGGQLTIGVRLTPLLEVDAAATYSSPEFRTAISADVEGAPATTASAPVREMTIGGALVVYLPQWRVGSRGVPFVEGGAAWLRQIYDTTATVVNDGVVYHGGGGLRYVIAERPGRRVSELAIRGEARAVARQKGLAPDGRTHVSPWVGA